MISTRITIVLAICLSQLSGSTAISVPQSGKSADDLIPVTTYQPSNTNFTIAGGIQAYFQAFTGNACDQGQGGQISFVSVSDCIWTDNRHSFYVGTNGQDSYPVFAQLYDDLNCQG